VYSIVGYNKNALESHLLATFSNKNPIALLVVLLEIGPMRARICLKFPGWRNQNNPGLESKTLDKKTVQHNVDDDILTKQIFPRAQR
jgi:hypothetical protein